MRPFFDAAKQHAGNINALLVQENEQICLLETIKTQTLSMGKDACRYQRDVEAMSTNNCQALSSLGESLDSLADTVATKDDITGLHQQLSVVQDMLHTHVSAHSAWSNTFDLSFPGLSAGHHSPPLSLADELEKVSDSLGLRSSSASFDGLEDHDMDSPDQPSLSSVNPSDGRKQSDLSITASSNEVQLSLGNTLATVLSDDGGTDCRVHHISQHPDANQSGSISRGQMLMSLYRQAVGNDFHPVPDLRNFIHSTCQPRHFQLVSRFCVGLLCVVTVWWLVRDLKQLLSGKNLYHNFVSPHGAGTVNIKYLNAYQDL